MLRNNNTIGRRIARLVAMATFLAVTTAALMQTVYQTKLNIETRKQSLEATAYALASAASDAVVAEDRAKASSALAAVSRIPEILMASITLPSGASLASLGQSTFLVDDVVHAEDNAFNMLVKGYLPITVDIIKGGEVRGQLSILSDITSLRSQVLWALFTTLAGALLAATLGVVASKPLQRRIAGPLTQLTQTIQALRSSRDYSTGIADDSARDETGVLAKAFNGLMSDIRFRDQSLQKLAYHDPLTGLPNRVSFQREIDEWLERKFVSAQGAVALINIHGFRTMNDAFGHSTGDAILMTVAATVQSSLRGDTTLARYGGDEFALLMRDAATNADVEMAMSRIQSAFFKPLSIGELSLHINLTVGAVILDCPDGPKLCSAVAMRYADLALAEAKRSSIGHIQFFKQSLADDVERDTQLGQELRQAIKDNAFELFYQPQFDLQNNYISGFEALIRWKHPERGTISPAVFIPLAEQLGLMSAIGDWVLTEGCRQGALWHRQGYTNRVMSINISVAQILNAGFVEKVRGALRKSGLPPKMLCLELTESIFVGNRFDDTLKALELLKKDGIKLALDDFGTGYSSLGYLSKLPFDAIKIDRSFVADADKSTRKSNMLKSIVEMVRALGMTIVAEGAERSEEIALLQSLNVEKVQGYVIAKPLPELQALQRANDIDQRYRSISA